MYTSGTGDVSVPKTLYGCEACVNDLNLRNKWNIDRMSSLTRSETR
jgi:hypothetical protein